MISIQYDELSTITPEIWKLLFKKVGITMPSPLETLSESKKNYENAMKDARWSGPSDYLDKKVYLFGTGDKEIIIRVNYGKNNPSEIRIDEFQADVIINGLLYLLGRDEK